MKGWPCGRTHTAHRGQNTVAPCAQEAHSRHRGDPEAGEYPWVAGEGPVSQRPSKNYTAARATCHSAPHTQDPASPLPPGPMPHASLLSPHGISEDTHNDPTDVLSLYKGPCPPNSQAHTPLKAPGLPCCAHVTSPFPKSFQHWLASHPLCLPIMACLAGRLNTVCVPPQCH